MKMKLLKDVCNTFYVIPVPLGSLLLESKIQPDTAYQKQQVRRRLVAVATPYYYQ